MRARPTTPRSLLLHKIILTAEEKSETEAGFARLKADLVKLGENI